MIDSSSPAGYFPAMFEGISTIIFDLDGTLIDSSTGVIAATNYALESLGQPKRSDEEIKRFIGHPLDEMFPAFCDAPLSDLKAKFQEKAKDTVVSSAIILPEVDVTLPELVSRGYTLGIATTKFSNHTEGTVKKFGWDRFFSALTSGNEVKRVKPAPDIILLAMERLHADPASTIMVGDTINDVVAAHDAGIPVITIKSPFGDDGAALREADCVLDSFGELLRVFT
ncbi:MAG: HAD family hydrolase [Candidatus Zixiibacteriota bacterium]